MSKQETRTSSQSNSVRVLGVGTDLSNIRHLRRAREQLRATGEVCKCTICTKGLEGISSWAKEKPTLPQDGNIQDSGADQEETSPLPPNGNWIAGHYSEETN